MSPKLLKNQGKYSDRVFPNQAWELHFPRTGKGSVPIGAGLSRTWLHAALQAPRGFVGKGM